MKTGEIVIIVILVIVAIIALLAILYVMTYNKLQKRIIRIKEAEAEIDETLRKKYDILVQMENVINDNTDLKQNNFEEFKKDDFKMSNFDVDRKLTKIADTFNKIKQDYPDDLDTDFFRNLVIDLKINEEKNEAAKSYYNKHTSSLNILVGKFPSNIIARIHKIEEHLYFDNKNMSDDDILDFKL
jgi:LemA protein